MKKQMFLMSVMLLVQTVTVFVYAQNMPKAGEIISGIVTDCDGPMMMVNVVERDSMNRMVAHSITDLEGNFSFRLVNPDHIIQITYVGYENVTIPIDTTYFEIEMKEQDDLPAVEITTDPGYERLGLPVPIRSDAHLATSSMGLMDPDSWYFGFLQKNAPIDYVCGYVVNNPQGDNIYSLFLVKRDNKYSLLRKTIDSSEARTIKKHLAHKLEKVINKQLADAEKKKEDDIKQASNKRDNGIRVLRFYDGNIIYVMNHSQIATLESGYSTSLPDQLWNDEAVKFKKIRAYYEINSITEDAFSGYISLDNRRLKN